MATLGQYRMCIGQVLREGKGRGPGCSSGLKGLRASMVTTQGDGGAEVLGPEREHDSHFWMSRTPIVHHRPYRRCACRFHLDRVSRLFMRLLRRRRRPSLAQRVHQLAGPELLEACHQLASSVLVAAEFGVPRATTLEALHDSPTGRYFPVWHQ